MDPRRFRPLSGTEEADFREHARKHYRPGDEIKTIWHPVYQHECALVNLEQYEAIKRFLRNTSPEPPPDPNQCHPDIPEDECPTCSTQPRSADITPGPTHDSSSSPVQNG